MYMTPTVTSCVERLAGLAVEQRALTVGGEAGHGERLLDLVFLGAVEHRRRHVHAAAQLVGEADHVPLVERVDERVRLLGGVDLLQLLLEDLAVEVGPQVGVDLLAERPRRAAEVALEDLADVHTRRNAERVEHDVDRVAVLHVRHVLFGQDARDDALVAVATGHLVADRQLALDGDVDLDHLDDARRELVTLGQLGDLVLVERLDRVHVVLEALRELLELLFGLAAALDHLDLVEVADRHFVERRGRRA